jgi:hypothetical protein
MMRDGRRGDAQDGGKFFHRVLLMRQQANDLDAIRVRERFEKSDKLFDAF